MKKIFLVIMIFSASVSADYSGWAKPTQVSLILSSGFRVLGSFGKPYGCDVADQVFISINHPQYNQIYSMALAAVASQSEIRFEVRRCGVVGWISNQPIAVLDSSNPGEVATRK